jgi:hypothetical protein
MYARKPNRRVDTFAGIAPVRSPERALKRWVSSALRPPRPASGVTAETNGVSVSSPSARAKVIPHREY